MRLSLLPLLVLGLAGSLSAAEPVLKVSFAEKYLAFTGEEFAALPHNEMKVFEPHGQKEHVYSGVSVKELLARVGAPLGEKIRGSALRLAVNFRSRDGYSVIYALPEFDESFSTRTLLLADKEDGKALAENAAPFHLIAPGDKRAARWARMVTSIEIVTVANDRGDAEKDKTAKLQNSDPSRGGK